MSIQDGLIAGTIQATVHRAGQADGEGRQHCSRCGALLSVISIGLWPEGELLAHISEPPEHRAAYPFGEDRPLLAGETHCGPDEPGGLEILTVRMSPQLNDVGAGTVREYLVSLLSVLWEEGEKFDPLNPFGNGDWKSDLRDAVARAGYVPCTEDGGGIAYDEQARDHIDVMIGEAIEGLRVTPYGD